MMPFAGGVEASPNAALILSVVAAVLYGVVADRTPSLRRTVVKTLAVAMIAVVAVMQGAPILLVIALVFCALGDAFLSREGENWFLAGLASFLIGHALYISLFVSGAAALGPAVPDLLRVALAILMALFALAMLALLWPNVPPRLRAPIFVYAAAIFLMGLSALTLNSAVVVAGAVLFMISDGMLATERFLLSPASPHRRRMQLAVWTTYYLAQLLITLGFVLAG